MYRAIPTANKLLQKRWQQKEFKLHKKKLREVKSCLNLRRPTSFGRVKAKMKKSQQIALDRYHEIDRENRILLNKMAKISERRMIYWPNTAEK